MYQDLLLTVKDNIATVMINRAEFSNALGKDTYREIKEAMGECGERKDIKAVILTGAGKHFSAGGDIKRFKQQIESKEFISAERIVMAGQAAWSVHSCPKPTIAMINGTAAGAGCSFALACDFRILSQSSKLVMAFINMALTGDTGGIYLLERLVGVAKTKEMLMLGAPLSGAEALSFGLATKLTSDDELEQVTYKFAKKLSFSPLGAIQKQKELINQFFYADYDQFTPKEAEYMAESSRSHDFEEAVNAFLEKRTPSFTGE